MAICAARPGGGDDDEFDDDDYDDDDDQQPMRNVGLRLVGWLSEEVRNGMNAHKKAIKCFFRALKHTVESFCLLLWGITWFAWGQQRGGLLWRPIPSGGFWYWCYGE